MRSLPAVFAAAFAAVASAQGPEQITIHYTGTLAELSVDYVSPNQNAGAGVVTFGVSTGPNAFTTNVTTTSFAYPNIGTMYQAIMTFPQAVMSPGTQGWYKVFANGVWSSTFTITPIPASYPSEKYVVFGDFGLVNDVVMSALANDSALGLFDTVLHVGDFAYNLEDSSSSVGNQFMELTSQSYAAVRPLQVVPGNHEACGSCPSIPELPFSQSNFTEYRARFHSVSLGAGARSGSNNNIYYSHNQGLVHFIEFSAEAYTYNSGPEFLQNQLNFIQSDLAAVDRTQTPWIVALVHKNFDMETAAFTAIYPLLDAAKVDVLFCGHVHYYNRFLPYDFVTKDIDNASVNADGSVYTNPKYLVNIVSGASGDKEGETPCAEDILPPSLHCDPDFGYGVFQALNSTHATWEYKSVKQDWFGPPTFTDSLLIINENH